MGCGVVEWEVGRLPPAHRSFIPDEHTVWCPEQLLQRVLAHIHYMPDHWQGNAHRYETRDEFAQLFQYKAVSLACVGLGWGLASILAEGRSCHRAEQLLDL